MKTEYKYSETRKRSYQGVSFDEEECRTHLENEVKDNLLDREEREASKLRDSNQLVRFADDIICPVVAIHGDYDPHPAEGVEKPLSERLPIFKMIRLEKCGHVPLKERQARDRFYEVLREELF